MDRRHFIHGLAVSLPFIAGCSTLIEGVTDTSTTTPPSTATKTTDEPSPTSTSTSTSTVQTPSTATRTTDEPLPTATATVQTPSTATRTAVQTITQTGTATETAITIDPSQLQTYTSRIYGYSVKYPSGWTVNTDDPTYVEIKPVQESKRTQMGISTYEREPGMTLDVFVPAFAQRMKQEFGDVQIVGKRSVTLSGGSAATVLETVISGSKFGGFTIHAKYCFAMGNKRGYMVQFLVFKSNYPAVKEAANTIVTSLVIP